MKRGTLYTIGYQGLSKEELRRIVMGLDATLVDCRAIPRSRRAEFNQKSLESLLGAKYEWMGDHLGGFDQTDEHGIAWIRTRLLRGQNLVLMCMEHDPEDCHRHNTICGPHFPEALHIFEGDLIPAAEVSRMMEEEDDSYETFSTLEEALRT